mgnify:CR=1 FL=1
MKPSVVIIGYGRFGKIFASILKKKCNVFIVERKNNIILERGIKRIAVEDIGDKEYIFLAVPINKIPDILREIAAYISPQTIVCDVCSVKEQPILWMKKYLPSTISIIGTHPLFGPDSVTLAKNICISTARISKNKLNEFLLLLKKVRLIPITITAPKHDKLMAQSLFVTQFIGRSIATARLLSNKNVTKNSAMLNHIAYASNNDSMELFRDMYRYNRFAKEIPEKIIASMQNLKKLLQNKK